MQQPSAYVHRIIEDVADMPLHIETPLIYSPVMSSRLGYSVYLKMENLQPSQSFKYRGISLFVSRAIKEHGPEVRIVAATSGSAGIALAWVGKHLNVRTSIFLPASATSVKAELELAGAEVIVGGTDYADALLSAQAFCETNPQIVLMSSYDHPTLWEGHSTMIHEIASQLPNKSAPNAIICNVGGGGLLGGVLRGVNELKWDCTKLIAFETHGANCYHLSLLANSPDPAAHSLIPEHVSLFKLPKLTDKIPQAEVTLAKLPAITSEVSSLGARSPSQTTLELGLARTYLTAVSVPDQIAMQATLGFLGRYSVTRLPASMNNSKYR
ncbi:tryptophan synthase beta subunit-like PLP-dependent enzyme [Rhizoctonia solani]|nr:tryptophan synthase beta subunit-like PLP-dependent enzyme [Rhizoctonia solani]